MKNTLIRSIEVLIILSAAVAAYFLFPHSPKEIELNIPGLTDYCQADCSDNAVQTYDTAIDSVENGQPDYGASYAAQVCFDEEGYEDFVLNCHDVDVSSLPNVKMGTTTKGKPFSNYVYFGLDAYNEFTNKGFFVYYIDNLNPSGYVYTAPHVLVSYDFTTHKVTGIGQIDLQGLAAKELYISPRGINAIIVNQSPGSFWSGENHKSVEGVTSMNLETGMTSRVLSFDDESFRFVDWIDDTHFIYTVGKQSIVFKLAVIKGN